MCSVCVCIVCVLCVYYVCVCVYCVCVCVSVYIRTYVCLSEKFSNELAHTHLYNGGLTVLGL